MLVRYLLFSFFFAVLEGAATNLDVVAAPSMGGDGVICCSIALERARTSVLILLR